jgi:hypothetical protein
VWDVTQKAEVAWLSPEEAKLWGLGPLAAPAYSPDGKRLLTPSVNGTIRVWDAEDLAAGSYFSKNLGQISHLEFSPDKRRVLIWNHYDRPGGWFEVVEDSVGVYDAETCELIKPLGDASTHMYGGKHINACGYTRDGTQIFTVTEDRGLETRTVTRLFSAETLEQVEVSIDTPMPERRKAEASDADSHLVAETWGEFLELKDNKTGRLIATFVMLGNGGVAGCGVNGKVIAGDSVGRLYFLQLEEPPLPSL